MILEQVAELYFKQSSEGRSEADILCVGANVAAKLVQKLGVIVEMVRSWIYIRSHRLDPPMKAVPTPEVSQIRVASHKV